QLMEAGMSCYRVQFPRGMDANEYAQKVSPAGKSLELALRSAVFMGKGKGGLDGDLIAAVRAGAGAPPELHSAPEAPPAPAAPMEPAATAAPTALPVAAPADLPPATLASVEATAPVAILET